MQKTILIADDDPHIREVIQFALEKVGLRTLPASNGKQVLEQFTKSAPDLIVLDIGMPEMDGLEVCKTIRKTSDVPILFLSSRDEEVDRVVGLEIGGDDYVTKPFSPRELAARIHAILKRSSNKTESKSTNGKMLCKGLLELNQDNYTASWNGVAIELTAIEFNLLKVLLSHPEKVCTREEFMDKAYDRVVVSDRTIDSHIRKIRSKFAQAGGENVIGTVHGIGYKLGTCLQ